MVPGLVHGDIYTHDDRIIHSRIGRSFQDTDGYDVKISLCTIDFKGIFLGHFAF